MTIWYILCSFGTLFQILVSCIKKIWQPWRWHVSYDTSAENFTTAVIKILPTFYSYTGRIKKRLFPFVTWQNLQPNAVRLFAYQVFKQCQIFEIVPCPWTIVSIKYLYVFAQAYQEPILRLQNLLHNRHNASVVVYRQKRFNNVCRICK
jgi:hypothetical protein